MRTRSQSHFAFPLVTLAAFGIAAIHSLATLSLAQSGLPPAGGFRVLHRFTPSEAVTPYGLIQASDGLFYGTGNGGGTTGYGIVFKISSTGEFTTLHSFSKNEGTAPQAGLVQVSDGNFYGTTTGFGTYAAGAVFRIARGGNLTVLHMLQPPTDPCYSLAPLVQASDGNLYGTSQSCGTTLNGTVFQVTLSGQLTVLHNFTGGSDGYFPDGPLIQASDGMLYGTTSEGGGNNAGTVFRLNLDGSGFTTVYSFNPATGGFPLSGVIQANDGNFYGATFSDGPTLDGSVYKLTADGAYTTLHTFSGTDGRQADGIIQAKDGNFYGTTYKGGPNDYGTIFRITSDGSFTVLHNFNQSDGDGPNTGVVQGSDGKLYGVAAMGGNTKNICGGIGCGTVFALSVGQ